MTGVGIAIAACRQDSQNGTLTVHCLARSTMYTAIGYAAQSATTPSPQ